MLPSTDANVKSTVYSAAENASKNGWEFFVMDAPVQDVVNDMKDGDCDLEDVPDDVITFYLLQWRREREATY